MPRRTTILGLFIAGFGPAACGALAGGLALFACDDASLGTSPQAASTGWPAEACTPDTVAPPDPSPVAGEGAASLTEAASCEDVLRAVRQRLRRALEQRLATNLDRALHVSCLPCYQPRPPCGRGGPCVLDAGAMPGSGPGAYSQTNVQVAGVDEPDLVKTDGRYLYVAAPGRVDVIDAWPVASARVVSRIDVLGTPRRLFLIGDRLLAYSILGTPSDCTYAYSCEFEGDGRSLRLTLLDVSDRARPRVLRETDFGGAFLAARRVGSVVHTAVAFEGIRLPQLSDWPADVPRSPPACGSGVQRLDAATIRARFAALAASSQAIIDSLTLGQIAPGFHDVRYLPDGAVNSDRFLGGDCREALVPGDGDGARLLALASFDAAADGPIGLRAVLGRSGAVYASAETLYVASPHRRDDSSAWYDGGADEATTIHKFRLDPRGAAATYAGSGVVPGRVLNQLALDEQDGYLRLATTSGHLPGPVTNTITVLGERAGGLRRVGALDGLAPNEDIRAARFDGDRAYVVTFKKTDPLFVIDLATPTAPRVLGELMIPGFSTYLHRIDPTHLLAIGFDADDMGSFAWFQGLLLQLFDVADPARPRLLYREVIGTRGSASAAALDHLAFTWFPERNLLGIPVTICGGGSGGSYGSSLLFSGLLVYEVGIATGFTRLGGIPHVESSPYAGCGQWWSTSTTTVKRSVFMDGFVYSVASDVVKGAALADLEHPLVSLGL